MPEIYLRQAGFTYSACGPYKKTKKEYKKLKKQGFKMMMMMMMMMINCLCGMVHQRKA